MSTFKKKFLTLPLIICLMVALVGACAFGLAGCAPSTVRITLDAAGGVFVTDDGEVDELVLEFKEGEEIVIPSLPVREPSTTKEFIFDGWDKNMSKTATSDATFVAQWSSQTRYYTITFLGNGGQFSVNGQPTDKIEARYTYEAQISMPNTPTKPATAGATYSFDGYDQNVSNRVISDATYTATWQTIPNTYEIVFDANGGLIDMASGQNETFTMQNVPYGQKLDLPDEYNLIAPVSTDTKVYEFSHWARTANGSGTASTADQSMTVFAVWTEKDRYYTVTFDAGDGEFSNGKSTYEAQFKFGEQIVLPANVAPTRTSSPASVYRFESFGLTDQTVVTGEGMTFAAIWAESTRMYEVTFDAGNGNKFISNNSQTITVTLPYNAVIQQPAVSPVKDPTLEKTYAFSGYADFTNNSTTVTGENMRFVAEYLENDREYIVTFSAGDTGWYGDNKSTKTITKKFKYNEVITAPSQPADIPQKESTVDKVFAFAGYEGLEGNVKVTSDGLNFAAKYTSSVRIYNIVFDAGEGLFPGDQQTIVKPTAYGSMPELPAEIPVKQDTDYETYMFGAWSVSTVTGDRTYTAAYGAKAIYYSLTFYDNTTNGKVALLPEPIKFKAVAPGEEYELTEEQLKAIADCYFEIDPVTGFAGFWNYQLANQDLAYYAKNANGEPNDYIFGDGSQAKPYVIADTTTFANFIESWNLAYYMLYELDYQGQTEQLQTMYSTLKDVHFALGSDIDATFERSNDDDALSRLAHQMFINYGYPDISDDYDEFMTAVEAGEIVVPLQMPLFVGTLDGKGHKIHGLDAKFLTNGSALFDVAADATIKNLDFYVGKELVSLVGTAMGGSMTFENVNVYNEDNLTILTAGDTNESAYIWHSKARSLVFRDCSNYANYASQAAYFGIFLGGYTYGDDTTFSRTIEFDNCVNYGTVSSSASVAMLYGNGFKRNFDLTNGITITNCRNEGVITAVTPKLFLAQFGGEAYGITSGNAAQFESQITMGDEAVLNILPSLTGTSNFNFMQGVNGTELVVSKTPSAADYVAGIYTIDAVMYATMLNGNEDAGTLRLNISSVATLDNDAGQINFEMANYTFINVEMYFALWGQDATENLLENLQPLADYPMIYYAIDAEREVVVFYFDAYIQNSTDITDIVIQSDNPVKFIMSSIKADGHIGGYAEFTPSVSSRPLQFVGTEATLRTAVANATKAEIVLMGFEEPSAENKIELTESIVLNAADKDITINLAGTTLASAENMNDPLFVINAGSLKIVNSEFFASYGEGQVVANGTVFKIDSTPSVAPALFSLARSASGANLLLGEGLTVTSITSACIEVKGSDVVIETAAQIVSVETAPIKIVAESAVDLPEITITGGEIKSESVTITQTIQTFESDEALEQDAPSDEIVFTPVVTGIVMSVVVDGQANYTFTNLSDAIYYVSAAQNGGIIELMSDNGTPRVFEINSMVEIHTAGTVEIVLNGNQIVSNFAPEDEYSRGLFQLNAGNLTISKGEDEGNTGKIYAENTMAFRVLATQSEPLTTLTLGEGVNVEVKDYFGIYVAGPGSKLVTKANISVIGTESYYAISGNGTDGKEVDSIHVNGGRVSSLNDAAIYLPNLGNYFINNGAVVEGTSAVYQKSGVLTVNAGATLIATGAKTSHVPSNNGSTSTGDALVIEPNAAYPSNPETSIQNGAIFSVEADTAFHVGYYLADTLNPNLKGTINTMPTKTNGVALTHNLAEITDFFTAGVKTSAISGDIIAYYATLDKAIAAAQAGETVTLLCDVSGLDDIYITRDVTLDLNGFDVTFNGGMLFLVNGGHFHVTGEGIITANSGKYAVIQISGRAEGDGTYSKLTVDENVTLQNVVDPTTTNSGYTITVFGPNGNNSVCYNTTIDFAGKSIGRDGFTVNGNIVSGGPVINIRSTAVITAQTDNGGLGLYLAGNSQTTIESGAKISGDTAVYIKSGNLTVNGATITGTGEAGEYSYVTGGAYSTGDAIVIEACGYPADSPIVNITSGTFTTNDANAYGIAYYTYLDNVASITIAPEVLANTTTNFEARIGTTYFATLADAIAATSDTDTVVLTKDLTIESTIELNEGKVVNLDLGGNTISSSIATTFQVNEGSLTVNNGIVSVDYEAFRVLGYGETAASLTLGSDLDVVSENDCCIYTRGPKSEITTSADLTSRGEFATIQGNGSEGNNIASLTINGGSVTGENDIAVYVPHSGTYTITGGAVISGVNGMHIKSGILTIDDAIISATGEKFDFTHNGNGSSNTGDALIIEACDYPGGTPTVQILGGTFTTVADEAYGIAYYSYITLDGENATHYYAKSIDVAEGVMTVTKTNFVAKTSLSETRYFASLAEAVSACPVGTSADNLPEATTITLLRDTTADGVVVSQYQNIIFDLNNFTYNIKAPTVGSAGTKTNGLQLLAGSDVTIKNGTITSGVAHLLIQNYADLILENVTAGFTAVDPSAPKPEKVGQYVVSNNFGTLTVKGNTVITAREGKSAFDLWYGMSRDYAAGVSVTFDNTFTGSVTGIIEYGAKHPEYFTGEGAWTSVTSLTIEKCTGTFNTTLVLTNGAESANITVDSSVEFNMGVLAQ